MAPITFFKSISIPWGKSSVVFDFSHERWKCLESIYIEHYNLPVRNIMSIPKVIHQIWIGTDIPEDVKFLSNKIQQLNPDWEYKLWTDSDLTFLDSTLALKVNMIENLGAKSDFLRYLIINEFGGLYLDCDFVPTKSFSDLIYNCDFLAGVCNPDEYNLPLINNGFFASIKKHPILDALVFDIYNNLEKIYYINSQNDIFKFSGPELFTNKVFDFLSNSNSLRTVIYPSTFFYPINFRNKFKINERYITESIRVETFAVHLWSASWFKEKKNFYSKMKLRLPYRYFIFLSKILTKIKKIIY